MKPEPDPAIGQSPFGDHHAVGQALADDPWVREAIAVMAARAPAEEPAESAEPARKCKRKDEEE